MPSASHAHFWLRTISSVTRRINFVLWAERFAPGAFAVAIVTAMTIYAFRRLQLDNVWAWAILAAGLIIAGIVSWFRMRSRRFSQTDSRVLLEYKLRLDSSLTAAESGLTGWPTPRAIPPGMLNWRSRAVGGWLLAGLAMIVAGGLIPVSKDAGSSTQPFEKPPALVQTDAWLDALAKLDIVEPKSIDPLMARAAELARQSPENQYTHSGLEAADTLREQTAAAMQSLAHSMESASSALSPIEQDGPALSAEQLKAVGEGLESALRGMREGSLAARSDLQKALESGALDPRSITPEQAAQLRSSLGQGGQKLRGIPGAAGGEVKIAGDGDSPGDGKGGGKGSGKGKPGKGSEDGGPGSGDVSRGPGTAPLTFSESESNVTAAQTETVSNQDMSRAALGDLLGTKIGEHDLDPSKAQGITSGGAPASAGSGGEAVWVNRLTPEERSALSTFFK